VLPGVQVVVPEDFRDERWTGRNDVAAGDAGVQARVGPREAWFPLPFDPLPLDRWPFEEWPFPLPLDPFAPGDEMRLNFVGKFSQPCPTERATREKREGFF
jgi:hypothetical protein